MSNYNSDSQSSSSGTSMPDLVAEGSTRKEKEARLHFPCKVYDMLEDADQQGHKDIVSWNASGTGFTVHNKDLFTKTIIPQYFNQTKYKSFQRQLSLYGFQRITGGENKGLRYHEKLRRGMRDLCRSMKPIGYKPRSSEAKEVMKALSSPSPLRAMDDALPAVISSNSLPESDGIEKAALIQTLHAPVEFTADGFPEMGCFEGKTFYLMDSRSFAHLTKTTTTTAATTTAATQPVAPTRPLHNADTRPVMIDGQMKRAWEIGFEMAMAMKTGQNSNHNLEHAGIDLSSHQQPLYVE
ncbi:unnamed protein product [Cylindrotheca closterium]|uniref:HSF-type DNA-binding domain-containing protein n=1 Tax=Cylindrotheca closterium TaxID=2856 RepID=A0AAD2PV17_9STRA|nr:unnamed protein product [Cylindrotheca closterium]